MYPNKSITGYDHNYFLWYAKKSEFTLSANQVHFEAITWNFVWNDLSSKHVNSFLMWPNSNSTQVACGHFSWKCWRDLKALLLAAILNLHCSTVLRTFNLKKFEVPWIAELTLFWKWGFMLHLLYLTLRGTWIWEAIN